MPGSDLAIEDLESNLGLTFKDQGLLKQALVHRSYLNEHGGSPLDSYERMEFLGDAVLELIVSTELYHKLPGITEGELTKGRSFVVCRPSLARAARRLSMGKHLSLGKGELESGGQDKESILEEAFESVVAAIYLDQGYEAARGFALRALGPEIEDIGRRRGRIENPKSRLQEMVQGMGLSTPHYRLVSTEGPDHQPVFTVEVLVDERVLGLGKGSKKTDAERAAAEVALDQCEVADFPQSMAAGESIAAVQAGGHLADTAEAFLENPDSDSTNSATSTREKPCSHSSSETGKTTRPGPNKASSEAGNGGSAASSMFSGPLTWMKRFGKSSKKS